MVSVHRVTEVVMVYASMASGANKVMANTSVTSRRGLVIGLMYRYLSLVLVSGSSWASIRLLGLGFGFMLGFYWVNRRLLGLRF